MRFLCKAVKVEGSWVQEAASLELLSSLIAITENTQYEVVGKLRLQFHEEEGLKNATASCAIWDSRHWFHASPMRESPSGSSVRSLHVAEPSMKNRYLIIFTARYCYCLRADRFCFLLFDWLLLSILFIKISTLSISLWRVQFFDRPQIIWWNLLQEKQSKCINRCRCPNKQPLRALLSL